MQLGIAYDPQWQASSAWRDLVVEFRRTVDGVGLKEAAYQLDTSPSQLAHALAERDRHYIRGSWMPYLIQVAPDNRSTDILCRLRGLTVTPAAELTPEQKLERLTRALGECLGDDLRQAIYERAWR
jgi:hypothetical protein